MNKEAAAFLTKTRYDFADLCTIMKLLRAPGGCPWDREQTHRSIRKNLIEETYEVVEAIDNDDNVLLREELGDLMLQVVFHARMAEEEGAFDIGDVCDEICRKLIVRHPHIFSDVTASTSGEVLDNWDKIKRATKKQKSTTESMQSVSRALPSLMRAYKLGEKAAKTGFDFPDAASAADGLREELDNSCARFLTAVTADGTVAGYIGCHTVLDEGYIANVAVSPVFRRQGIGRQLVRTLLERSKDLAFVTLEVRASNAAAIALYTECGFQSVGVRKKFYSHPTEDALLMTVFLQAE